MAAVPVMLGVAMAYFLRQVYMLALAIFSPVMLLGSYVSDRRHGRKSHARQQAGGRSTQAVIGECYDGPFAIDLRKDGPHGLVAGTTGAGKSELLQTLIASLALVNRPDAMTFVRWTTRAAARSKTACTCRT